MMTATQVVREYVALVADRDTQPILRRGLRRLGRAGREDVIDRATERVCRSGLPLLIDSSPRWWPIFTEQPGEARKTLVLRELDNARQEYKKQNGRSGGTEALDPLVEADRARHMGGGTLTTEPTVELEHEEAAAEEQRTLDIIAAENAAFLHEVEGWASTLPQRKWEVVWRLLWGFSYEQVRLGTCNAKGRGGASEKLIKPLRDRMKEIADAHLLTDTDGKPYTDTSLPARPEDESEPVSALVSQYVGLITQINRLKAKGLDHHEAQRQLHELREKLKLVPDAEKQILRMPAEPETSDMAARRGSYRESAAYVGDSADSGGGPNRYIGRRPSGTKQFTDLALSSGSLAPTREERTRGPGYIEPTVQLPPTGTCVRHAKFGIGFVRRTEGLDALLVEFADEQRLWIKLPYVDVVPGAQPAPKVETRVVRRPKPRVEATQQALAKLIAEQAQAIDQFEERFGRSPADLAQLRAMCEAEGWSLEKLFGGEAA